MMQAATPENEIRACLKECREHFAYAALFSAAINILLLTPIIYMLTVYDRVVASGSLSTLAMLTILMVFLLASVGGFEWVRTTVLVAASSALEARLRNRVMEASFTRSLITGSYEANSQSLADLTALRHFLTGNGLYALLDAPWFPVYIGVMFMFHPFFGLAGILSGAIMIALAIANNAATSSSLKDANDNASKANARFQGSLKNSEVVAALGMMSEINRHQSALFDKVNGSQNQASMRAAAINGVTKSFRLIAQSSLLGMGAYLALNQQISPGMMIAGSLLLGRALAPIDVLVGTWKNFSVAYAQYNRLNALLTQIPKKSERMPLPSPKGILSVERLTVVPPGSRTAAVKDVSLNLQQGEILGVVGPSASGKSSLARAMLGVWPAYSGKVRLDGADISSWDRTALGHHIGYIPQDVELFDGTVSDNISRFRVADPTSVVDAAKLAGVHDLILRLPSGYDTVIGSSGGVLSGGQRQRIGLARAVFGAPKFLVLDEPNSNLDDLGEKELVVALNRIKAAGCTTVVITHRTLILQCVDKILVLKNGATHGFGTRDQILSKLAAPKNSPK